MAVQKTAAAVDDILEKIDKCLVRLETFKGNFVKHQKAEHDILACFETARDIMMAFLTDKTDTDRSNLTGVFGGDCVRTSRMRMYLEQCELSELHAKDKRRDLCSAATDAIENVLREKGLADALRNAANKVKNHTGVWEKESEADRVAREKAVADAAAAAEEERKRIAAAGANAAKEAEEEARRKKAQEEENLRLNADADFRQRALEEAIAAVKAAIANKSDKDVLAKGLQEPSRSNGVSKVLGGHSWDGNNFKSKPDYDKLLKDLEKEQAEEAKRRAEEKRLADDPEYNKWARDAAIKTLEEAIKNNSDKDELAKALADPAKANGVKNVLNGHTWDGSNFKKKPDYDKMLKELKAAKEAEEKLLLDEAINAVRKAIDNNENDVELAKAMSKPANADGVKNILKPHKWDGSLFSAPVDKAKLLDELMKKRDPNSGYTAPSTKSVETSAAKAPVAVDSAKRMIIVTVGSELDPSFDFGPGGTMESVLKGITVKLSTTSDPVWPEHAKPYEAEQKFVIQLPEVAKVVFDPAKPDATPGAKITSIALGHGKILEIPPDLEIAVGSQTMAPWGSHKLMQGSKETELHYEVEVNTKFSMTEMPDDSTSLEVDLQVIYTAWLTGHASAIYQPDGKPVAAPVREKD